MSDKFSVLTDLSNGAKAYREHRNGSLFSDTGKEPRTFTKAEACAWLNDINSRTLDKYAKELGIDPKRHDDAEWRVDINEIYQLRDLLPEKKRKASKLDRRNKNTQIIVVQNQKGGVGKTISAVTLASCLASQFHQEYRVGLIDLDGQATASMYYAPETATSDYLTVSDLIRKSYELDDGETDKDAISQAFITTSIPNLRILPASQRDRQVDGWFHEKVATGDLTRPYAVVDEILDAVRDEFDIIIIDTPPALTYTTINAYFAATSVICPISTTENDLDATSGYFEAIEGIGTILKAYNHRGFDFFKILITNYMGDSSSVEVRADIEKYFGDHLYSTEFKHSVAVKQCSGLMCTLFDISKSEYPKTKASFQNAVDNAYAVVSKIHSDIERAWSK
ncbi:partitioning protein A [Vibrio angustum S14]|uniref:Partitioning protein A n=1 Tax=Photobacterium angustum (strain S14 / CCUG 15956) TaxID=314292 RepID=Q1ZJV5_PHOAS|nr:ParA family protein [Photobacterium angustum]EAS62417.1 partitioning protein A [Vibrio angustum S14] [Photobacterium angustum S14]